MNRIEVSTPRATPTPTPLPTSTRNSSTSRAAVTPTPTAVPVPAPSPTATPLPVISSAAPWVPPSAGYQRPIHLPFGATVWLGPSEGSAGCGSVGTTGAPDVVSLSQDHDMTNACAHHDTCWEDLYKDGNSTLAGLMACQENFGSDIMQTGEGFLGKLESASIAAAYVGVTSGVGATLWATDRIPEIRSALGSAWDSAKASASAAWDGTKTTASSFWDSVATGASATWDSTTSFADSVWSSAKESSSSAWNGFTEAVSDTWSSATSWASSLF